MRLTDSQALVIMLCIVAGTFATRSLPILLFPESKEQPKLVEYLSQTIPAAMMGLLVVYCLKGVELFSWPHGLPEAIGVGTTVLLHLWKKNVLLSILVGTVVYMVMVQMVFV